MITKFEKKVIAGLTSFAMCLSMVFAVPISVNAETEQTQEKVVSGEQQNEAAEDVQTADGMMEKEAQDMIAADESPEKEKTDTVENGDAAKENEEQQTEPYEETSAPQMLNANEKEAVAGEINIKGDGTPQYGSADFTAEQKTVRYRLKVDADGQYYIGLIEEWGMKAEVSLLEDISGADDKPVTATDSRYDLRGGGYYFLDIKQSSDQPTGSIKWYAGKVRDIKPGDHMAALTENVETIHYNLTVDETGWYRFDCGELFISVKDKESGKEIASKSFCKLEQGHTYYIAASENFVGFGPDADKWSVKKGRETSVKAGQVYWNEGSQDVYYKFLPEKTGEYVINESGVSIYDEAGKQIQVGNAGVKMEANRAYYITVIGRQYWSIREYVKDEQETTAVQEGKTYKTPLGGAKESKYTFTPTEKAVYRFSSEQDNLSLGMKDFNDISGFGTNNGKINYFVVLEQGKSYEFSISGQGVGEASWNIKKAAVKTVEEGTEYTTTEAETTVYNFVAKESGEYMVSSNAAGNMKVYSSDWQELKGYSYNTSNEFGMKVSLEKDKTYHLGISVSGKDAKWKIESVKKLDNYSYRVLADDTVEILKYSGTESDVTIPEKIEEKAVKSIGYGAFVDNKTIVSVTIPAQVTDLKYGAFMSCRNLGKVTFAEGSKLQKIGGAAFTNCSKLLSITLPASVQAIESYGFSSSGLRSITLSDSITTLGEGAFSFCSSLNNVTLGSGLKGIEKEVFSGCRGLNQIEIPSNITYISDGAFSWAGLTSVKIPDSVTSLGKNAFSGCQYMTEATIGNNIAYVADSAFASCALKKITCGEKIKKIGKNAFANNRNLDHVKILEGVTEIEYGAFNGCRNLRNLEFPYSVEAIGGFAFDNEHSILGDTDTDRYHVQVDGDIYEGKVYYKYKGEAPADTVVNLRADTKGIAGYAFYMERNLKEVVIPESVTNIGEAAFMGCESMKTVTIPASVKTIGREAFGYLTSKEHGQGYKVDGFTIRGTSGSAAQKYAQENGFKFEPLDSDYVKGDSDSDGKVTIGDVRTTLRYVCKKAELSEKEKLAADVEQDGTVDIKDLRKVLRYVCNKIEEL